MIKNIAWVLPRPKRPFYPGSFPLHFEKKLFKELGMNSGCHKILQPFGGKGEYGIRLDINADVRPHVIGDAHNLPFKSEIFDAVLLDPPYSDDLSKKIYKTGKINFKKYTQEALRVLRPMGFLILYHFLMMPTVRGTKLIMRILLEIRVWHYLRCVHVHQRLDTKDLFGQKIY